MNLYRIALANVKIPASREESVALAVDAIGQARAQRAKVVCFPECFVPGYVVEAKAPPPIDTAFLQEAWARMADAAGRAGVAVILGTERAAEGKRHLTALVIQADGSVVGFQDKVQLAPPEDKYYAAGSGRRLFQSGPLKFGVVICHEGWRYPETVRAAARQGAHVVFHPHFDEEPVKAFKPMFADPTNTFHEKAMLCRAAENTCYFASVNCAGAGPYTTSAIASPDGTLLVSQPYGVAGLLVADIDLDAATGYLASRCRSPS